MENQKSPHLDEIEIDEPVEHPSDFDIPEVSEKSIRPSQSLNFGTYISLIVDDWAVQMAAVAHFGHYRKILAIEKHHISSQHNQKERLTLATKTVNDFIVKHKGPFSVISLAISGRETVLRNFLMPTLSKNDLASAIEIEAKKLLPFPVEDCSYDFRPISVVKTDKRELYNISLLAATRRLIKEKLEPFGEYRKNVEHIYHAPDAVGRLLPHIAGFEEFGGYTTLNIGQTQSEIAFYRGSSLEFYNVVATGASVLGSHPDEINYSFLAESLANEIQMAIDFYTGRFSRTISNRIFVYGELAYSNEVIESLKSSSGYTFERFPIDKLTFISKGKLSEFEAEIRVCLPVFAAAACPAGMADVLPRDDKKVHRAHRLNNYARAALITLFVTLFSSWGLLDKAVDIKRRELSGLNLQVGEFTNSEAFKSYNLLKRQIAVDKTYLESAASVPTFLSLNLKELSLLTPKE
ncbi:MAG: pilus assembly protein PilM, partial [Candidatus Zixiibacteriota bacterium]